MPIETLHFLIIEIQKTGSMSYTRIRLLFQFPPSLYVASITPFSSDFFQLGMRLV